MKIFLLPALTAALLAAVIGGPANAATTLEEYRKSVSLEEVADAPALTDAVCDNWKVEGNRLLKNDKLPKSYDRSAFAAGRALTRVYVEEGFITVRVQPDQDSCTLKVSEMKASPKGFYEKFVPNKALTTRDMEQFGTLISRHAADSQQRVRIYFDTPNVDANTVPVITEVTAIVDPTQTASTIVYNSLGPRYSGSDVLTGYVKHSANGIRAEGSATVGIPGLRQESKGGNYGAFSGKVSGATPYGIFGIESNISHYKVGGPYEDLEIAGTTWRTQLVGEHPLSTRTSVEGRLGYVTQNQKMSAFDLTEDQNYGSAYVGIRTGGELYGKSTFSASAGLMQGLFGKQDYTLIPLSGAFDKGFTLARADASVVVPLSAKSEENLQFVLGGQLSKSGVPNGETFYLGGMDRGSSYATGVYAGHSGVYAGTKYNYKVIRTQVSKYDLNLQPFAGINGGMLKQATGSSVTALSAELGTNFTLSKQISGAISYAHRIDSNGAYPGSAGRLNLAVNMVF